MILQPIGFSLKRLISVYVRKLPDGVTDDLHPSYYMEAHDISVCNGKPVIGAGRPFTKGTFKDMETYFVAQRKIANKKEIEGLLYGENNLIYCDQRIGKKLYIWRVKSQRREIIFDKTTKLPNGFIIAPDMIFMTDNESLSVFVVDDSNNLYDAPFFNLYVNGDVCLGTTDLKAVKNAKTFKQYTEAWEQAFWGSKFSSHGISQSSNIKNLLKEYINNNTMIPINKLTKRKETIQSIILKQSEE